MATERASIKRRTYLAEESTLSKVASCKILQRGKYSQSLTCLQCVCAPILMYYNDALNPFTSNDYYKKK